MPHEKLLPIAVQPVVRYPRQAQIGKTYLMTIDLQPVAGLQWSDDMDEEYPIYCMLDTAPLFTSQPRSEPAVVLHRFGGTYGPAEFLLTAAHEEMEGSIRITLVNGHGVPIQVLDLPDIRVMTSLVTPKQIEAFAATSIGTIARSQLPAEDPEQEIEALEFDERVPISVHALLEQFVQTLQQRDPHLPITYDAARLNSRVMVEANEQGLQTVLTHLVDNQLEDIRRQQKAAYQDDDLTTPGPADPGESVESGPRSPSIVVHAEVNDQEVMIHVQNASSMPLSASSVELFTQPVEQLKGRGSPLLFDRRLIEQYGGRLSVTANSRETGVQLTIHLPRYIPPPVTKRPRIVLLVENDPPQHEGYSRALQRLGYTVLTASSPPQALDIARSTWIHLAVVDDRLIADDDPLDFSGIDLALSPEMSIYPRILYTSFKATAAIEVIQRVQAGGVPTNIRIFGKADASIENIVEDAFGKKSKDGMGLVGINFDQVLKYEQPLSRLALPLLLKQQPPDDETALAWAKELEDLLGKAFPDDDVLNIAPFPQAMGFILIVIPERDGVHRPPFIVKCGSRSTILNEYRRYERHVHPYHAQFVAQILGEPTQTLHFGLLRYMITDGDVRNMRTFAEFYRQNTTGHIQQAVHHLLSETERSWYHYGQLSQPDSLLTFYQDRLLARSAGGNVDWSARWENLRQAVDATIRSVKIFEAVQVEARGSRLHWTVNNVQFDLPDPHTFLTEVQEGQRLDELFPAGSSVRRCHGNLHAGNILVDDHANTWLIDFEHAGFGPPVQDPVELESSIHFGLINERNLSRLLRFEHLLMQQVRLSEPPALPYDFRLDDPEDAELKRAFDVIMTLRETTSMIEGVRLKDYLLGLIFQALRVITLDYAERLIGPHRLVFHKIQALFLASACCERLTYITGSDPVWFP